MTTIEALEAVIALLPALKKDEIAPTTAEGEAILQTLFRTAWKAKENYVRSSAANEENYQKARKRFAKNPTDANAIKVSEAALKTTVQN